MRLDSLESRHLRAFVALVDHGGVTAAARALGVAQSTVSEAIAALERTLGARLFARRRRSTTLSLTAAGEALLPHARLVLAHLESARAAVASAATRARATVDIITNESISAYLLPAALAAVASRWPGTRFPVSIATCEAVRAGVAGGGFQVGLLLTVQDAGRQKQDIPEATPSGHERRVLDPSVDLVAFANPRHALLEHGRQRGLVRGDLTEYPVIVSDAAGEFHMLLKRYLDAERLSEPNVRPAGSIDGVKRAVEADANAIGILPRYAIESELRAVTFAAVPVRPPPPRMRLEGLACRVQERHPAIDDLFQELVRHN